MKKGDRLVSIILNNKLFNIGLGLNVLALFLL